MKTISKHIPNAVTCCNLICGCLAVWCAFKGLPQLAFIYIVIGAIFDFFDGFLARLLHVSSPIGKELDSLADVITFGFAPSALLWYMLSIVMAHSHTEFPSFLHYMLPFSAFIMAAFSALRLAKFNLDERQSMGFIGMPTPANALFWGSLIVSSADVLSSWPYSLYVLLATMLLACYLLVSEVPMFALKFKSFAWRENKLRYLFVLSSALLLVIFQLAGFAFVIVWYIVLSVFTQRNKGQI